MAVSHTIRVPLGPPHRAYEVLVGPALLERLPELLSAAAPAARYAIITDTDVARLYGMELENLLREAGLAVDLFEFAAGEASKTRETWTTLTDSMLSARHGRDSAIIALGGGVAADLGGFVAATYMRGLPLVQAPTSLLAMVDAAVGGKTGVDTPAGKNLVGAFHQPRLVLADILTLDTLPDAELRAGLAECVKHGAIGDAGHLDWVGRTVPDLVARRTGPLAAAVRRSVEIKTEFVAADTLEAGPRSALNFGHTVGHGLEAATSYAVPHGFAVSLGMLAEAVAGEAAGITQPGTAARIREALEAANLPVSLPVGVESDRVMDCLRLDKKARAGRTRYTLLSRPGAVARGSAGEWTLPLDDALVRDALERLR